MINRCLSKRVIELASHIQTIAIVQSIQHLERHLRAMRHGATSANYWHRPALIINEFGSQGTRTLFHVLLVDELAHLQF